MPSLKRTYVAHDGGRFRRVVTLVESRDGDVYVTIQAGVQIGSPPESTAIKEYRFSVHPSAASRDFTTLKRTVRFHDGSEETSRALTQAVKSRSGFFPVFAWRTSDLQHGMYDVPTNNRTDLVHCATFDRRTNTPVVGLFVGHSKRLFPRQAAGMEVHEIKSTHFKLVLLCCLTATPATPFASQMFSATFAPEEGDDPATVQAKAAGTRGIEAQDCLDLFRHMVAQLVRRQVEQLLAFAEDGQSAEALMALLREAPEPPFRLIPLQLF